MDGLSPHQPAERLSGATALEDRRALADTLARLQRCIEHFQSPALSEVRQTELLHFIEAQTRVLNRHFQRLLNTVPPTAEPVDLDQVLAGTLAEQTVRDPGHSLVLRLPASPLRVAGPAAALALVFQIVVEHTQRNAPAGATVEVAVGDRGAHDTFWTGQVRWLDTAAAGSAAAGSDERAPAGWAGLALSLAEQMLRALGGSLCVEAGPAAAAAGFCFSLPKHREGRRWTVLRPRLLVIDDDAELRGYLAEHFSAAGYDVRMAPDGPAGLALARQFAPHLVLLDMRMTPLDGKDTLARLREETDAAIVFLTAVDDKDSVAEGLWQGAADYITKPFHIREVMARARAILRRRHGLGLTEAAGPAPAAPYDQLAPTAN
jgi:CheY-like chemotaxis protein